MGRFPFIKQPGGRPRMPGEHEVHPYMNPRKPL